MGRLTRRIGLVAGATLALVAATWSPAGAVTNVRNNGPSNVGAYAASGSPEFGCWSNAITTAGIRVWALPGYRGQHVYAVAHLQIWSSGAWRQYTGNPSFNYGLHPGGYVLNPSQSVAFPGLTIPVRQSGYYRAFLEVDWRAANFAELGNISAWPSKVADYTGKYVYSGLYCAAGPWAV